MQITTLFKVEELKEAIADSLAAIKLNFDDEDSVKFLSICFEKNIRQISLQYDKKNYLGEKTEFR